MSGRSTCDEHEDVAKGYEPFADGTKDPTQVYKYYGNLKFLKYVR